MNSTFVILSRAVSIIGGVLLSASVALAGAPVAGPNVNMVTGTTWPAGDPFLTKQNEPSLAVSSRNPMHLFGGANDYRLTNVDVVPITGETDAGDAWVTIYKSTDGGGTWRASLIKGCPQPIPECGTNSDPIKASNAEFAADPTISPGPYGTFFYSFIAGRRANPAGGVTAVQRFVDLNNDVKSGDDPFVANPPTPSIIDTGTTGQFLDKSWNIADIPLRPWNGLTTCTIPGYSQPVPAFNVYISYSNFVGQSGTNPHPQILVARSTDCGATFGKPVKISQSVQTNQGSTMAIDPQTGKLYVFWRVVADPTNGTVDAIYMNTSSDGGNSWANVTLVSNINPFDQGDATGVSFRTRTFPTAVASVDSSGNSRVHVAWAERTAPLSNCLDASGNVILSANCDARIRMRTYNVASGTWSPPSWVDNWTSDSNLPFNPGRGHQLMPALTFAGGKLAAAWYDQRLDATVGRMVCTLGPASCQSMLNFKEIRVPTENFVAGHPEFVFNAFLADAPVALVLANPPVNDSKGNPVLVPDPTQGLARRHTIDVFGATADPADAPVFTSGRISQYLFGDLKGTPQNPDPNCPPKGICSEQQQQNPPNLPIAAGGTRAFIGDYLGVAAQTIVPTPPTVANGPAVYKFNCGKDVGTCVNTNTQPVFHSAWTDNRDVVRPFDGNWTNHTPIHVIVTNPDGTVTVSDNTGQVAGILSCGPGQDGSRNSNIYTAAFSGGSRGLTNANTKKLDSVNPRGFVVGVQNLTAPNLLDTGYRAYRLTILGALSSCSTTSDCASFDRLPAAAPTTVTTLYVPPQSSSWRTVWALSSTPSAAITVDISMILNAAGQPITTPVKVSDLLPPANYTFQPISQVALNSDPLATLNLNADSSTADSLYSTLNNSTLSNSTLSNATLNNSTLSNLTLSNLTLNNSTLSNSTLNNYDVETLTLNNSTLSNNTLNNATLSNATLSNSTLNNLTLSNSTLSNATLSNLTLSNVTLSNADLSSLALSNLTLNNNTLNNTELADTGLTNNQLTSDGLTNSYPADTTYTVTNSGNTDTTIDVKTLLRGQKVPDGYTLQVVLRKVALVPAAVGGAGWSSIKGAPTCYIGLLQQNAQVANLATPIAATDDTSLGQFINDPTAGTLPLSKDEVAQLTLRVVKNTCTTSGGVKTCGSGDPGGVLASGFISAGNSTTGARFVAIGQAGTTTSIPLVIKTLALQSVVVHKATTLTGALTSLGGKVTLAPTSNVTWTQDAANPSWVALSPANGVVPNTTTGSTISLMINKPPAIGNYNLKFTVTDANTPAQSDTQVLQLVVTAVNP